jgi:RHS repeat-associated protein
LPAFTDSVTGNTQWAVGFVYDNNSNLITKTDPRNITSTYTYDPMNRALSRIYSNDPNQTPAVDYKYDGAGTNGWYVVGKLTAVNTSGSFVSSYTYDTFDAMGRVAHSTQTTDGNSYGMSYGYDLAGNLISETYPSNRVVSTAFDVAGRINDVSSGATHYASSFSYSAHGGVTDVKLGNNLWEHTTFEANRLQPKEIDLGTSQGAFDKLKLNYDYGALSTNNGNVMGQTITIPSGPTLTQSYTYDGINRLLTAQENSGSSWKQTFLYDRCGNRTIDPANTNPSSLVGPNPQISGTTNRITSAGYSYDYAGNLKTDAAGHSYDYDAENMQVKYDTAVAQYFYDGEGRRAKSITNNQTLTTLFVYDAMGKMLAEYTNTNPAGGGTSYLTQDALGSPRIITASNQSVKARHDYLPFGEEITVPVGGRTSGQGYIADSVRPKFTGQLRDLETGFDYFGARYYWSAVGRFCSADSSTGSATNPQSMNLYCYGLNNPLKYVDPTGHDSYNIDGFDYYDDRPRQQAQQKLTTLEFNATAAAAVESGHGTYADYGLGPVVTDAIEVMAGLQIVQEAPNDSLLNQLAGNISAIFSEGMEDAVRADHTPTGPEAVVWQAMEGYLFIGGVLTGSSAGSLLELGAEVVTQQAASKAIEGGTEIIERAMSTAELQATESTGLVRGGREGTHYVSDFVNSDPLRARQRLALPQTPEVRVTLEVPKGVFSPPTRVNPNFGMPGGGMERAATGKIAARILQVFRY